MQTGKVDKVASILRFVRSHKSFSKKELKIKLDLPDNMINDCLNTLISKKLAEYVDVKPKGIGKKTMKITERGMKFLELYDAIRIRYLTNLTVSN